MSNVLAMASMVARALGKSTTGPVESLGVDSFKFVDPVVLSLVQFILNVCCSVIWVGWNLFNWLNY